MRVLVTGGAGYIGSVTVAELVRAGHKVVVFDNLSHGHLEAVPSEAKFIQGDIADQGAITSALQGHGIEAVMHFAALIEAGESMVTPERFFRNNTAGTLTLLECMLREGVKRLVFSSTAAVYGDPQSIPIQETDPLQPTNAYGESKLMVEKMLGWFQRIHGLSYASLRYFNAAGATEQLGEAHHPESHLIPLVLQVALGKRKSISIFGSDYPTKDGTCVRDYIHVFDLARAHVLAMDALAESTKLTYNLGNGIGFTVKEVIECARTVTGHPIPAELVARRPGDPAVLVASSEKIGRELGWKPKYPELKSIIESAWKWHCAHPDGYENASVTQRVP